MKNENKKIEDVSERAHREYMEIQRSEMLGEVNRYFASLKLCRPPTDAEAIMYYIESGGAKNFFDRYGYIICPIENPD